MCNGNLYLPLGKCKYGAHWAHCSAAHPASEHQNGLRTDDNPEVYDLNITRDEWKCQLGAFNKTNQFLFIRNREQSNLHPQHAHIGHTASPPAQDRTQRRENNSTVRQKLLHQDQPNRAECISPEKGLMKGNCNHEAWQADRWCCCGNGIGCSLSSKPRTEESQVKPADKRCGKAGIPHPTSCSALAFLVIGWLTAKAGSESLFCPTSCWRLGKLSYKTQVFEEVSLHDCSSLFFQSTHSVRFTGVVGPLVWPAPAALPSFIPPAPPPSWLISFMPQGHC